MNETTRARLEAESEAARQAPKSRPIYKVGPEHFRRDTDGAWMLCTWEGGVYGQVDDRTVCLLDELERLLGKAKSADPDNVAGEIRPIDNPFFRNVTFDLNPPAEPIPACFLTLLDGTRVEHEFKTGRWYFVNTPHYERAGRVDSALAVEALRALARKAFDL